MALDVSRSSASDTTLPPIRSIRSMTEMPSCTERLSRSSLATTMPSVSPRSMRARIACKPGRSNVPPERSRSSCQSAMRTPLDPPPPLDGVTLRGGRLEALSTAPANDTDANVAVERLAHDHIVSWDKK